MALILATTYPDVFAAAGVHSATAYRSATQSLTAFGAMAARGSASPIDTAIGAPDATDAASTIDPASGRWRPWC